MEAKTQQKIIKFLKSKGAYVIKSKPGPGTPVGCPDIIFLYQTLWGVIEVKSSETAPFRPLQKETINKLGGWSYARIAYPGNVDLILEELYAIL